MSEIVVGCSAGTGWVVLVGAALASGPDGITVVDRRRVELVPDPERFAYHLAAERDVGAYAVGGRPGPRPTGTSVDLAAGERLVADVRSRAVAAATEGLRDVVGASGVAGVAAAVMVGPLPDPEPPDLATIVRSHTAMHAAEGELYREAVRDALAGYGVETTSVVRKGLVDLVAGAVGLDVPSVQAEVDALGKTLGPPWRKEQKEAALAAWWGLVARG